MYAISNIKLAVRGKEIHVSFKLYSSLKNDERKKLDPLE